MSQTFPLLMQISNAVSARVAAAAPFLAAISGRHGRDRTGMHWRDDVIVTSEQALPSGRDFSVRLHDGRERPATLAGRDPSTNVALLRLTEPAKAAPPRVAQEPRVGELVLALGAGPAVRMTVVQSVGPAWHSMLGGRIDRRVELDMRARHVEEGGPVLDTEGRLIGMATAGPRGTSLAIPHETIVRVLEPLLGAGRMARGWLGVGLQPVAIPDAQRAEAGQQSGLMVVSVAEGGPCAQAGVLMGDILLTLDGENLSHPRGIRAMLGPERVGQTATLRLMRAGAVQTVTVTIAARPEE